MHNMHLKQFEIQIYKEADEKLLEFAHIHINNSTLKCIEAANRILLTNTSKSFFAGVHLFLRISGPLGGQVINLLIMNQSKEILMIIHCCTNW